MKLNSIYIYLIIVLAAAARFVPHLANVAPVTAIAIFAGAYLPKKQATALPLIVRFISDIFLGFFSWPLMVAVYAAHLFGVILGVWIRREEDGAARWLRVIASGAFSAAVFFLVTNFAFLYKEYPHTAAGVMLSYTNGLPFLRGTVVGDVGYTVALFAIFEFAQYLVKSRKLKLATVIA